MACILEYRGQTLHPQSLREPLHTMHSLAGETILNYCGAKIIRLCGGLDRAGKKHLYSIQQNDYYYI
jgi:hypothetical protein